MRLTPTLKFLIIAWAFVTSMFVLAWTGIQLDLEAVGLNPHIYAIVLTIAVIIDKGATALLAYLGLRQVSVNDLDDETILVAAQARFGSALRIDATMTPPPPSSVPDPTGRL